MGNGLRYPKKQPITFWQKQTLYWLRHSEGYQPPENLPQKPRLHPWRKSRPHRKSGGVIFVLARFYRWSLKETVPTGNTANGFFFEKMAGFEWMFLSVRGNPPHSHSTHGPPSPRKICQVILQLEAQQLYPVVRYVTYIIDTDTPSYYGSVLVAQGDSRVWVHPDIEMSSCFPVLLNIFWKKGNLWHQSWSKIPGSYPFTRFYKAIYRGEMGELKRPMGTPCFDEKGALEASQDVPRHDIQNPKECNRIPSSSKNNNG